jgi:hypothetical protein
MRHDRGGCGATEAGVGWPSHARSIPELDRLLQVRCAVYNGTLGAGFGQRFYAANDALPPVAAAA